MHSTFIAYREKDYDYLYNNGLVDLNVFFHYELWEIYNQINYAFEDIIMQKCGYDIDVEHYYNLDWVKEMKQRINEIKENIEYDNRMDEEYTLWLYDHDLVKVELTNGTSYVGRMVAFDDHDPEHAWLTFKEESTSKIYDISFNDVRYVSKIKLHFIYHQ